MIFKVSENLKGSFVLNTIQKVLSANTVISISGNKLLAPDVKMAIKKGHLIPLEKNSYDQYMETSSQAMLVNKTGKVLVVGEVILKPWASILVDKKVLENMAVQDAIQNNIISVVSDETKQDMNKVAADTDEIVLEKNLKIEEDIDENKNKLVSNPEPEVKSLVWDFKTQTAKEAQKVPKTPDILRVEEKKEEEKKVIEFVDEKKEPEKSEDDIFEVIKISQPVSPEANKQESKISESKKKEKSPKSTKNKKKKNIEPVGEIKPEKTVQEAVLELDSRGNPIKKASDELKHLIDFLDNDDVKFVDQEQKEERLRKRNENGD